MMISGEELQHRVRTALLATPNRQVLTQDLRVAVFGLNLPQGALMALNQAITDLIKDNEPIRRDRWGCRIVLPCETDALWASASFVAGLDDHKVSQADLFGEAAP